MPQGSGNSSCFTRRLPPVPFSEVNTSEFKVRAAQLKELSVLGVKIIGHFKDYIAKNLADELRMQEEKSPTCLRFSFYGLSLLFRVELRLRENSAEGAIVAYWLSYSRGPAEAALNVSYAFDKNGNMRGGSQRSTALPYAECAPRFFMDVFSQIAMQDDAVLRP